MSTSESSPTSPYCAVVDDRRALPKTEPRVLVTVLTVAGDVDASTGPKLADDLSRCAALDRPIVVDFSMLDFFGVRGVHVLIEFDRQLHARGLPYVLVTCPMVDHMASLIGVGGMLRRVASLRAALWRLREYFLRSGGQLVPMADRAALQC